MERAAGRTPRYKPRAPTCPTAARIPATPTAPFVAAGDYVWAPEGAGSNGHQAGPGRVDFVVLARTSTDSEVLLTLKLTF